MKNPEQHFVSEATDGKTDRLDRKKKSPTRMLEEDKEPACEAGLVKVRGGEYVDYREKKKTGVSILSPEFKVKHIGDKPYSTIHTHPRLERGTKVYDPSLLVDPNHRSIIEMDDNDVEMMRADVSPSFPSDEDLLDILGYRNKRSSIIGQRDPITGKVAGYYIIRRTKATPLLIPKPEGKVTQEQWRQWYGDPGIAEALGFLEAAEYYAFPDPGSVLKPEQLARNEETLKKFADKYNLKIRMVPNQGYEYKSGLGFLKK